MNLRYNGKIRIQVNTIPLSSIIEELGFIDLLKLDCEGAEYEILSSAYKEGALDAVDKIAMEIHGSATPILKILSNAKFSIDKIKKMGDNPSFYYLFASKSPSEITT
jgi:hypothetical protein